MSEENLYQTQQQDSEEVPTEPLPTLTEVAGITTPEVVEEVEEPEIDIESLSDYERYRLDPSKANLARVTRSLQPTIDSILASYGDKSNPHLQSRAKVVAAKAIKSYKPEAGSSLATWVSSQLRQLTRDVRKSNNVLSIPEGIQLDSYALYRAEKEFEEEHDREPTIKELADLAKLSQKRIKQIRKKMKAIASDSATTGEDGAELVQNGEVDYSKEALDYVYNDSDTVDQKLLEYTVGYGGETPLNNKLIMQKLRLTPVQLSRRKMRLSIRIRNIIADLERS